MSESVLKQRDLWQKGLGEKGLLKGGQVRPRVEEIKSSEIESGKAFVRMER